MTTSVHLMSSQFNAFSTVARAAGVATLVAVASVLMMAAGPASPVPIQPIVLAAQPARTAAQSQPKDVSETEAFEIGIEAYEYFYPLVTMEITRRVSTNFPVGAKPGMGPMNTFHHLRAYPSADFREVVRPNFDTLYSVAWIDVGAEPQIISAPDTQGRYYLLPMIDMWSNVIAVPGKRTSGTKAGSWALVPPGWTGELPTGVERINATTRYTWIIGRTQTNGPSDYAAVHTVQDGYTVTPLSSWGKPVTQPPAKIDPSVDMKTPPMYQVNSMPADQFFALGAELMTVNPPQPTDWSILARMKRVGISAGRPFDFSKMSAQVQAGLRRAVPAALEGMKRRMPTIARVTNGWQMNTETMGVYGNAYQKRAIVALVGLGANQPEDAVYPLCITDGEGKPLTAEHKYELHFPKQDLPPVGAFWSVTMYDAEGYQVANPINRFAIGDRDNLKYNADGSLTLYIQHENPGPGKESNWLPSPATGVLGVTMRLYAPLPPVLDGRWNPPAFKIVK